MQKKETYFAKDNQGLQKTWVEKMITLEVIEDILKKVLSDYRISVPLRKQLIKAILEELK
jgi:hypothetical protein